MLIEAHLAGGDIADAYRVYESFRLRVARELGAVPSAHMRALVR